MFSPLYEYPSLIKRYYSILLSDYLNDCFQNGEQWSNWLNLEVNCQGYCQISVSSKENKIVMKI